MKGRAGAARARFGRAEVLRLWLSYQRYALLLFAVSGAVIAAAAALAPSGAWWLLAAVPAAGTAAFACSIYGRWPRKLRATALADRRIESGSFHPRRLRGYCGDPCFRVVAAEILARAGYPRRERNRMIREFARDLHEPVFLLVVDHAEASVRVNGDEVGSLLAQTASKGERG